MDRQRDAPRPEGTAARAATPTPEGARNRYTPQLDAAGAFRSPELTKREMEVLRGFSKPIGEWQGRSYFNPRDGNINKLVKNTKNVDGIYTVIANAGIMSDRWSGRGVQVGRWELDRHQFADLMKGDPTWNKERDPKLHLLVSNGAKEGRQSIAATVARETGTTVIGYTSDLWFPGGRTMICSPAVDDLFTGITYERDPKMLGPHDSLLVEFGPDGNVSAARHAYPRDMWTGRVV